MTAPAPIRVVLADDHALVLEGLRNLLAAEPGVEILWKPFTTGTLARRALDTLGAEEASEARKTTPSAVPASRGAGGERRLVSQSFAAVKPDSHAPSVLLVEDDDTIRETIKDSLSLEGFQVTACGNGRDALKRWIVEHHAREHALGDELNARFSRHLRAEPHSVANGFASFLTKRRGHSFCRCPRRQPRRLARLHRRAGDRGQDRGRAAPRGHAA